MNSDNSVQQKQSLTLISYSVRRKNGERCGWPGSSDAGSCGKGLICYFKDHGRCKKNSEGT